ncbi:MAG: DUF5916 domain-containing protein [Vicinamibacteria bacterium]
MFNLLIWAAAALASGPGQTNSPAAISEASTRVQATRIQGSLSIDGKLDEPQWQTATPYTAFTQRDPDEGQKSTEETDVRVLYDDDALYIGARMNDTQPSAIKALLGRRDAELTSDWFTVFLDSYNDKRTGFYFGISAGGTLSDGTLSNDDWDNNAWDGIWEGKAKRDETGWTIEFRIPLSQLRFKQEQDARWGINFKRWITRTNEQAYASPRPKKESGFVSRFLPLVGLNGLQPKRRFLVTPYTTAKTHSSDAAPGDPFNDGRRNSAAFGADFKLGLGSNLTLDATVNPDFGQVEVDPAVVNLSDVESFFEEKRPFFIEGADTFEFGYGGASNNMGFNYSNPNLFYSRRIGRPPQGSPGDADFTRSPGGVRINAAAKVTGKIAGSWNLGVLHAMTGQEEADLSLGGRFSTAVVEPRASYSVVRAQRDFNAGRQGLGFIGTFVNRDLAGTGLENQLNNHAGSFGVDGWTTIGRGPSNERIWALNGRFAVSTISGTAARMSAVQRSSTHYFQRPDATHLGVDPNATSLTGYAFRTALNREKGPLLFNAAIGATSPGFDSNDAGISSRTDQINGHVSIGHRWTQPGRILRSGGFQGGGFQTRDFEGNMTALGIFSFQWGTFKNYWGFDSSVFVNPETITTTQTRGGVAMLRPFAWSWDVTVNSDNRKTLTFNIGTRGGSGRRDSQFTRGGTVSANWKPAPKLSISLSPDYLYQENGAQFVANVEDPAATATYGTRHVFAHLKQQTLSAGIRLDWTFTPALSLQTYIQPLISSGEYTNFGDLARARSYEFNRYAAGDLPKGVRDPNFTFKSIRGNAVLRWEFRPGSAAYFVWTQNREDSDPNGEFRLGHSFSSLFDAKADNIFLVKFAFGWTS